MYKLNVKNKGMTLIEAMLYVGIFSIIFTGFIVFTFQFSTSIAGLAQTEDADRVGYIIREYVRWQIDHAEKIISPVVSTTNVATSLDLQESVQNDGDELKISESNIAHLFRFDALDMPSDVYFSVGLNKISGSTGSLGEVVTVFFTLHNKKYEVYVDPL